MKHLRTVLAVALCASSWAIDSQAAAPPKPREGVGVVRSKGDPAEKVLVRPKYVPGQLQQYRLQLYGGAVWTPNHRNLTWGEMKTDFKYTLQTKVIRDNGACTFNLFGEYLNSAGRGPDGSIEVEASPRESAIRLNGKWQAKSGKSMLARPMTITLGRLGAVHYGTGLAPLAIYMLPHIDRRFWTLLTITPPKEVAPGDGWEAEFNVAVPGGKGKPLAVKGKWVVQKWRSYRGRKVLPMALAAELDLKNSKVLLRNGDLIHVVAGSYKAEGTVLWDVDNGLLAAAQAWQKIYIRANTPVRRALKSEVKCTLELLAAGQPKKRR